MSCGIEVDDSPQGVRRMMNANGIWRAIAGQCSPLVFARMPDCVSPADFVSRQTHSPGYLATKVFDIDR